MQSLTGKHSLHVHHLRWTVDYQYAADELRTELLNASRSAPFGKRGERHRQLEKNVQSFSNCAPETFVELLFKAQDLGVPTETLLRVPDTLAALIRARGPRTQQLSMRELMQIETALESELNPIQLEFIMGNQSTQVMHALLTKFRRYREILDGVIAWLESRLYGKGEQ